MATLKTGEWVAVYGNILLWMEALQSTPCAWLCRPVFYGLSMGWYYVSGTGYSYKLHVWRCACTGCYTSGCLQLSWTMEALLQCLLPVLVGEISILPVNQPCWLPHQSHAVDWNSLPTVPCVIIVTIEHWHSWAASWAGWGLHRRGTRSIPQCSLHHLQQGILTRLC